MSCLLTLLRDSECWPVLMKATQAKNANKSATAKIFLIIKFIYYYQLIGKLKNRK